ncbi:hypothetical protein G5I_09421 [Acromyrmex echinatior]|uniref:Uncharacterized protein n=1 Tax=Acromyrmex echinatior TaxID=103372 RepID=F4WU65_ACREC|nr:hypothetical protein G5I_09421 [Acromyrmex echinatior]
MTPVPMDSATVSPTFWVKELNPFDMGLDLVRFQVPITFDYFREDNISYIFGYFAHTQLPEPYQCQQDVPQVRLTFE